MIWAIVLNGTTGFIMTVTFAYCIGPLDAAIQPPYFFAFIGTFYNATGSKAGATVMTCIITLLTLCSAISNVATASRQMFAFARDRGLPAADFLSYVRPGWDIPLNSILVSMCITALLSLINLGSTVAFNAIISIGVVSLLSSCKFSNPRHQALSLPNLRTFSNHATDLVSITCILYKRFRNETLLPRRWSAGRYGMGFNLCAWAYVVVAYVFAFFPIGTPVTTKTMNWASIVYGGIIVVAAVHYLIYARHIYIPPVSRLAKDL
jgi:amino acid transporter